MKNLLSLFALLLLICIQSANAQTATYHIANKFPLEGDGGWDYLVADDDNSRVFVTHGDIVQVMDMKDGKLIETIKAFKGVHGVALAPNMNYGFISNGRDSSVSIFNLKTLKMGSKIKNVGQNPDAILFDFYTQRVFVFNGRSNNVAVIDPSSLKIIAKIPLDGNPEFAVNDDKGNIYVNIEDLSMVCHINGSTMKVEKKWKLREGKEPSGLAIDKENHRLFSVCDNKLMVISDCEKGFVVATVPIGQHPDGAAYDAELKRAYSSNGDGTMTVVQEVDANTFKVLENVVTQKGARTLTLSNKTHHLYLSAADRGETPKPTTDNPNPRPEVKPNTFVVIDVLAGK